MGNRLIEMLLEIGCEVVNFDLSEPRSKINVKYVKGDLTKYEQVKDVMEGVDTVFHVKQKFLRLTEFFFLNIKFFLK